MKLELVANSLVTQSTRGETLLRLAPVPDFDVDGALQAIHIVDLADAANRQVLAVPRKRQRPDAADGALPLPRIVSVEDRHLEALGQLASVHLPDPHVADAVAAGQVLAV